MKSKLFLAISSLLITSTALANGYKIYLKNGNTVLSIIAQEDTTGARGFYTVERYNQLGASQVLSSETIVSGSMDRPITQPGQTPALPAFFQFQDSKIGMIKITPNSNGTCKVSIHNVIGFNFRNRNLGCSIFPHTDSTPGAFSGSN